MTTRDPLDDRDVAALAIGLGRREDRRTVPLDGQPAALEEAERPLDPVAGAGGELDDAPVGHLVDELLERVGHVLGAGRIDRVRHRAGAVLGNRDGRAGGDDHCEGGDHYEEETDGTGDTHGHTIWTREEPPCSPS